MATAAIDHVFSGAPRWRASIARWLWLGLVIALFCVPLFIGLGRTDLENDEAIYSFAVDVMVNAGDWLTPKIIPFENVPFLEKPPLKFWIVAAPIRLGLLPHDEFGLRFWDAVFGGLTFVYVFAIGRRLGGPLCGAGALFVLFAHQPLIFQHGLRANDMDAAEVLAYCAGAYHFLAWTDAATPASRRRNIFALTLYFVLGFMTKFVAVLFLPLVLAMMTLLSRHCRARLREDLWRWAAAAALAVALIAPWFLYQYHRYGRDLWDVMFGQHVVTRFTSYLDRSHLQPWHFYFSELLLQLRASQATPIAVAGLVLTAACALGYRPARGGPGEGDAASRRRAAALLLIWFAVPFALISMLSSKIYHYTYPFLPPVALAAGYAVALVFAALWSLGDRPGHRLDAWLRRAMPAMLQSAAVRVLFVALAIVAVAIAIATHAGGGRMRLTIGGTTLLTNASALRVWLVAVVTLILAARAGWALRVGIAATVVLFLLPVPGYTQALSQLPVERHPLRSLGRCLDSVNARTADPARRSPGVWVEGENIQHTYFYYFRRLGEWQYREDPRIFSDATVYLHLFLPSQATPVLLAERRYNEFMRALKAGNREMIERAARKAEMEPAALLSQASDSPAVIPFGAELLLLPRPYADCSADRGVRRAGR